MEKPHVKRSNIVNYCTANFINVDKNEAVNSLVKLIKDYKKIDLNKIRVFIEEEIDMVELTNVHNEKNLFAYFQNLRLLKAKELNG